jgi:aryl-alcohol dehydrogenase-like predicted oxidoreductase
METSKELRSLGHTGLIVTPIGLGCWQFSKQKNMAGKFWPSIEDSQIERIVSLSLAGGINWFDTAEVYVDGESEKALSMALRKAGRKNGEVMEPTNGGRHFALLPA